MSRIYKLVLLLLFSTAQIHAQLITSGGLTPTQLVQDVLVGQGIQLISVASQGDTNAFGFFESANTNLGLERGVILTTGTISGPDGPCGPNNAPNAGMDNGTPRFASLDLITAPMLNYNATILELTFVPTGDSIFIEYVFASEEYPAYIGSEFSDIIAIMLTGPNPAGGFYDNYNIANTPGTSDPVNFDMPPFFIVNNSIPSPGITIQYDGFTIPFLAKAGVMNDSAYIIRIAVSDIGDGIYFEREIYEEDCCTIRINYFFF